MAFDVPRLYTYPETLVFDADDEKKLSRYLQDIERATTTPYISHQSQLQLDSMGKLPSGFRYTSTAFKQICALLAPGLYQAVSDLSGDRRHGERPRSEYSFDTAVKIFNLVIAQRFRTRIQGEVRVIRNRESQLIEGVMGPKYAYLSNSDIYDLGCEAVRASARPSEFHEATIMGRRIMLRFVHSEPLFTFGGSSPERYYGGYHISNSEISGEACVQVSTMLLRGSNNTSSLGNYRGQGRIPHMGKDFRRKLNRIFSAAISMPQDGVHMAGKMNRLLAQPLGIPPDDTDERDKRVSYLTVMLHGRDITANFAKSIVLSAIRHGSSSVQRYQQATNEWMADLTMLDLYHALTREARPASLAIRETVEQAAYALLQGWLK